ncbi:MAG: hypothetical protein JWM95_4266 [Gemmatimonadetes bacterium]|nr:hypothetical protein [Gemmatimonadota bacterium]
MPRTALIAVHGVGSPPKHDTARAIADLLTKYGSETSECSYPSFEERLIKIPTNPVIIPDSARPATPPPPKEKRARLGTDGRDRTTFANEDRIAIAHLDIAFTRDQLAGYEHASEKVPYNTIEICGTRVDGPDPTSVRDVHVYEMYWSDLSRVGSGVLRIAGALYQLVLHIAHLGRKTLDLASAAAQHTESRAMIENWKRSARWHAWTLRLFTVGVPVFTLLMFACFGMFVPAAIAPERRLTIGALIIELVILVALGLRAYFKDASANATRNLVTAIFVITAAAVAGVLYENRIGDISVGVWVLNVTTTLIVLVAYLVIIGRYDTVAPGARTWGLIGLAVVAIGMLFWGPRFAAIAHANYGEGLRFTALAGFQFSYLLLMGVWILIWGAAFCTMLSNWRLRRELRNDHSRESVTRATRAIWTAKVTLALALFGLIVTALVGYQTANLLAWKIHGTPYTIADSLVTPGHAATQLSGFNLFPTVPPNTGFPLITRALVGTRTECPAATNYDPASCAKGFFDALIAESGTAGLDIALIFAGMSVLMISWFVVLIALTATRVPKSKSEYARNLGTWLTDGFRYTHLAGSLLVFGLVVSMTLGMFVAGWKLLHNNAPPPFLPSFLTNTSGDVLAWLAIAALASATTLAAARARIELLASRARPALGILLDVDNYLRESPADGTPKARMAERFTSLLQHVVSRKDADGVTPYFDRIVIVAHSQGTIITTDILRFLKIAHVASPNLENRDIRLLTMGSPLRQLYAVHFPHLYEWVDYTDYAEPNMAGDDTCFRDSDLGPSQLMAPSGTAPRTLDQLSPSPAWLGLRKWVNLYTSGDYVGRPLWQNDTTPGVWNFREHSDAVVGLGRRERCLGDGTHTRYWTSAEVAREIDDLVFR